jgi:hypothetical protein
MKTFRQFTLLTEQHDPVAKIRNLIALANRPGTEAEGIRVRCGIPGLSVFWWPSLRHG